MSLQLVFLILLAGFHGITARILMTSINQENKSLEPPPPSDIAQMARYIVHNSDWASVGTISSANEIKGFPFVGLKSISDGPAINGTGVPYMLMTDMDISMKDLNHESRCTLFMSLAEKDFCRNNNYDPQDPRCAKVMLTGYVKKLQINSTEDIFARNALYTKHPAMSSWPTDHDFFVVKLDILQVLVLDYFGGIKHVSLAEYFSATLSSVLDEFVRDIKVIQINF